MKFKIMQSRLPVARKMASEVICLPIYADLDLNDVKRIAFVLYGGF